MEKKVILSGIQPSGIITLGNYLGALSNFVHLQDQKEEMLYNPFYCVVDLHAITVPQNPKELREKSLLLLSQYLAAGLDPQKNVMFIQSHVAAHAELSWILTTMAYMGELSRMTQYKEKAKKEESHSAGLFIYPILMAADILLYQTDMVPVGEDQHQHLELARDLAQRFNHRFGDTFKIPQAYTGKVAARVMSLQEPTKKMSKSDENPNGYISLMDEDAVITKKIKRAVTDMVGVVQYSPDQPAIRNLLDIYAKLSGDTIEDIVNRYVGKGYGDFKKDLAEVVVSGIRPIREKTKEYMQNKDYLEEVYADGAQKAEEVANKTLAKVYKKVGFVAKPRSK